MRVKAYLDRINYHGRLDPVLETLRELHLAHLQAVPFENLSIHAAEPIVLEEAALFDKIVGRRRGGFCYELNGLFAWLLRSLGFHVDMLSAGVARPDGEFAPDFGHMTLRVRLGENWLADVGFGESFSEPLRIENGAEQVQGSRAYRISPGGRHRILSFRLLEGNGGSEGDERRPAGHGEAGAFVSGGRGQNDSPAVGEAASPASTTEGLEAHDWKPMYRFTLQAHVFADYSEMCRFHQTSPHSPFTQRRICSRLTLAGRITLSERRLIQTGADGSREERVLESEAEYRRVLREAFGVVMED